MISSKKSLATLLMLLGAPLLLTGCFSRNQEVFIDDNPYPYSQQNDELSIKTPKPIETDKIKKDLQKIIEDVSQEENTAHKQAKSIADELSNMWGPGEEDPKLPAWDLNSKNAREKQNKETAKNEEKRFTTEKTPPEESNVHKEADWMSDPTFTTIYSAPETTVHETENTADDTQDSYSEQQHAAPPQNREEEPLEEEQKSPQKKIQEKITEKHGENPDEKVSIDKTEQPSDIEKNETPVPEQEHIKEKSQEQIVLDIIRDITKYTSKKGQQQALKSELDTIENNQENLGILVDLKSFLPESFHASINEKISLIIEEEMKK